MSGLQFAVFRNLPLTCNSYNVLTSLETFNEFLVSPAPAPAPAHLLYEVKLDVGSEALLVEPDLTGEAEGVDLVEVVEDLLPVSPDSLGVLTTRNTSQLSLSLRRNIQLR